MGQFSNSLPTQHLKGPEREGNKRESDKDAKPVCLLVCSDEISFLCGQVCICRFLQWCCVCCLCMHVCRGTLSSDITMLRVSAPYVCFERVVFMCACDSAQPKVKLTDSFPLRSPLVFLIDRHNAKVQAPSLVPMLIVHSCIFMSSLGINQLNKGWGRWLGAVFIMTLID